MSEAKKFKRRVQVEISPVLLETGYPKSKRLIILNKWVYEDIKDFMDTYFASIGPRNAQFIDTQLQKWSEFEDISKDDLKKLKDKGVTIYPPPIEGDPSPFGGMFFIDDIKASKRRKSGLQILIVNQLFTQEIGEKVEIPDDDPIDVPQLVDRQNRNFQDRIEKGFKKLGLKNFDGKIIFFRKNAFPVVKALQDTTMFKAANRSTRILIDLARQLLPQKLRTTNLLELRMRDVEAQARFGKHPIVVEKRKRRVGIQDSSGIESNLFLVGDVLQEYALKNPGHEDDVDDDEMLERVREARRAIEAETDSLKTLSAVGRALQEMGAGLDTRIWFTTVNCASIQRETEETLRVRAHATDGTLSTYRSNVTGLALTKVDESVENKNDIVFNINRSSVRFKSTKLRLASMRVYGGKRAIFDSSRNFRYGLPEYVEQSLIRDPSKVVLEDLVTSDKLTANYINKVYQRIVAASKGRKPTDSQLASRLGISVENLNKIIREETRPDVLKAANLVGVSPVRPNFELIDRNDRPAKLKITDNLSISMIDQLKYELVKDAIKQIVKDTREWESQPVLIIDFRELGLNKQYLTGTQRGQARIEDGTDAVISLLRSAVLRFGFRVLVYNFPGLEESDITREQIEEQRKKIERSKVVRPSKAAKKETASQIVGYYGVLGRGPGSQTFVIGDAPIPRVYTPGFIEELEKYGEFLQGFLPKFIGPYFLKGRELKRLRVKENVGGFQKGQDIFEGQSLSPFHIKTMIRDVILTSDNVLRAIDRSDAKSPEKAEPFELGLDAWMNYFETQREYKKYLALRQGMVGFVYADQKRINDLRRAGNELVDLATDFVEDTPVERRSSLVNQMNEITEGEFESPVMFAKAVREYELIVKSVLNRLYQLPGNSLVQNEIALFQNRLEELNVLEDQASDEAAAYADLGNIAEEDLPDLSPELRAQFISRPPTPPSGDIPFITVYGFRNDGSYFRLALRSNEIEITDQKPLFFPSDPLSSIYIDFAAAQGYAPGVDVLRVARQIGSRALGDRMGEKIDLKKLERQAESMIKSHLKRGGTLSTEERTMLNDPKEFGKIVKKHLGTGKRTGILGLRDEVLLKIKRELKKEGKAKLVDRDRFKQYEFKPFEGRSALKEFGKRGGLLTLNEYRQDVFDKGLGVQRVIQQEFDDTRFKDLNKCFLLPSLEYFKAKKFSRSFDEVLDNQQQRYRRWKKPEDEDELDIVEDREQVERRKEEVFGIFAKSFCKRVATTYGEGKIALTESQILTLNLQRLSIFLGINFSVQNANLAPRGPFSFPNQIEYLQAFSETLSTNPGTQDRIQAVLIDFPPMVSFIQLDVRYGLSVPIGKGTQPSRLLIEPDEANNLVYIMELITRRIVRERKFTRVQREEYLGALYKVLTSRELNQKTIEDVNAFIESILNKAVNKRYIDLYFGMMCKGVSV